MTKETYLEQLKACLTNLEPQEIEDIIAHFHEHIDEACLDEYGIISELGQAEELAKTILESLYPGIDVVINQPISQHLSEQITLSDNIHSLSISLDQLDIIILPSESEEYAIDYPYQDNPYYPSLNYNLTDGHLSLTEEKASRIQNLETTSHFWHGFVKFNNHRKTVVHLYLPEKLNFLDVTTKVGDIEISHLHCQQVKLHSHSADISLKKLGISNIDLFSQNGDIDIEDSQFKGGKLRSQNGDMNLTHTSFYHLDIKNDNGDCSLFQSQLVDSQIILQNGDLDSTQSLLKNITMEMNNGDISIAKTRFDQAINICHTIGDTDITLNQIPETITFHLTNQMGDINIAHTLDPSQTISTGKAYYKEAVSFEASLTVTSTIGDINIS